MAYESYDAETLNALVETGAIHLASSLSVRWAEKDLRQQHSRDEGLIWITDEETTVVKYGFEECQAVMREERHENLRRR